MASESVIITPSQEEIDKLRGYHIGKWDVYDNYVCVHCQYSTLWIGKMEKHQAADQHLWPWPSLVSPGTLSEDVENVPVYE